MDVGLLQNLKDNNVAFLPYVDDENLREKLRPDIQARQVPEWNDSNYLSLLPRVVAEIWRSYLERTIAFAIKDERLRRTQLELELEKRNNQKENVFSISEDAEFEFISSSFDKIIEVTIYQHTKDLENKQEIAKNSYLFNANLLTVVATLANENRNEFMHYKMEGDILDECIKLIRAMQDNETDEEQTVNITYDIDKCPNIIEDLRLYSLINSLPYDSRSQNSFGGSPISFKMVFSNKFFRYRYWLAYHKNLPEKIRVEFIKHS